MKNVRLYFPNLVAELARLDMTKSQLGAEAGIAMTTIYSKFKGETKWTLKDMEKIKAVLERRSGEKFSLDYLFVAQEMFDFNKGGN